MRVLYRSPNAIDGGPERRAGAIEPQRDEPRRQSRHALDLRGKLGEIDPASRGEDRRRQAVLGRRPPVRSIEENGAKRAARKLEQNADLDRRSIRSAPAQRARKRRGVVDHEDIAGPQK